MKIRAGYEEKIKKKEKKKEQGKSKHIWDLVIKRSKSTEEILVAIKNERAVY